jgi:hypothetical protein
LYIRMDILIGNCPIEDPSCKLRGKPQKAKNHNTGIIIFTTNIGTYVLLGKISETNFRFRYKRQRESLFSHIPFFI